MLGLFKRKRVRDLVNEVEVEKTEIKPIEEKVDEKLVVPEKSEQQIIDKDVFDEINSPIENEEQIEDSITETPTEPKEVKFDGKDISLKDDLVVVDIEEGVSSSLEDDQPQIKTINKDQFVKESFISESDFDIPPVKGVEIKDSEELEQPIFDKSEEVVEESVEERKDSLFKKLKNSLTKTKDSLFNKLNDIFNSDVIDEDLLDDLEEALFTSDIGVKTTERIIDNIRDRVKADKTDDPSKLKAIIHEEITKLIKVDDNLVKGDFAEKPYVILVVGVNGNGKTTTIGKLAKYYKGKGKKVLIGAADTFRAAAIEQLETWAKRADVDFVKDKMDSDPAAVAYNSYEAAVARGCDVVMIDTAGRLHNKINLMKELEKISKVLKKKSEAAPHEVLLVLDATTGQNAISQARNFTLSSGVTGLVLTKLDGTAKGGVAIAINQELNIPIKFIGIGEKIDDIKEFDPKEYVQAIFE